MKVAKKAGRGAVTNVDVEGGIIVAWDNGRQQIKPDSGLVQNDVDMINAYYKMHRIVNNIKRVLRVSPE